MTQRQDRVREILKQAAAEYLHTQSSGVSLITVTVADLTSDLKRITILVTIYPEEKEKAALDFLKRKRRDFRIYVKEHTKLKYLPAFDFAIDRGEKHRQRIDELLQGSQ